MNERAGSLVLCCATVALCACDRPDRAAPVAPSARAVPSVAEVSTTAGDAPARTGTKLESIAPDRLCVTSGAIVPLTGARFSVTAPTFRAVAASPSDARAELRFTYLGPTATTRALGSGALRQQLGLKLRAQDPCNLVYVMWRLDPEQRLVVSVKKNLGERTSRECGNLGYTNVKPRTSAPLPPVAVNASHVLFAEMSDDVLHVFVDDVSVWEGSLGRDAAALAGPVGVRTDNVRLEAELAGAPSGSARPCGAAEAEQGE